MAKELKDVAAIQQELVEQVYSAVQWEASMREMLAQGVDVFIECGPGKVLSGLLKKLIALLQPIVFMMKLR